MKYPYLTKDIEGIGGKIKQVEEHFIVEEIPLYEPSGTGEHLYINFTKKALTTRDIENKLRDLFHIKSDKIGFAGLKDKYAITTQTVSLHLGKIDEQKIKEIVENIEKNIPIKINRAKLHKNKLRKGHLLGNKFTIIISDLNTDIKKAITITNQVFSEIEKYGLPNYYGEQRFGTFQDNYQEGLQIIVLGKHPRTWIEKFLVSSYQSYLFNEYLKIRIEQGFFDKLLLGDIAKKTDTGGLFKVENLKQDQKRFDAKEISFTGPLYGKKMLTTSDEALKFENAVLEKENISMEQLEKSGVLGNRRPGRIFPNKLSVKEHEDGIKVEFFLPKGSYATILLREIMKIE